MSKSNRILFSIVFSFVFNCISAQDYSISIDHPEMRGEEIGILVASIRIAVKITQRFSYDEHVSSKVVEPKSYDYQSESYWKPPSSFSSNQLHQMKMRHFEPKSSKNRIKVDGDIGAAIGLYYFAKFVFNSITSAFKDEYCNCDKCKIQGMSYGEIQSLYNEFMQKYEFKNLYHQNPAISIEKAWESLDFHKMAPEAQEILKQRFEEIQRQRDDAERRKWETEQAQKKAAIEKKKKKAEKIQKKSFQEVMQLSKNDFLFSSEEVIEKQVTPWAKRISRRREAIKCVIADGGKSLTKRFKISHEVVEFLKSNEFDVTPYQECCGNELQQTLHQEFIEIVLNTADLSQDEAAQEVQQFQKLLLSCSKDGCGLNKQGMVIDAMSLSDFCQSALDAGCTTIKGKIGKIDGQLQNIELEAKQENALQCANALDKNLLSKKSLQEFSSSFEYARRITEYRENEIPDYKKNVDDVFAVIGERIHKVFSEEKPIQKNHGVWSNALHGCLNREKELHKKRRELVQEQALEQMPELHENNEELLEALSVEGASPWYDCELWNERAQKYKQAMDREFSGEQTFQIKTFSFSDAFKHLVEKEGVDGRVFAYCEGNDLQQVLHEGFIEDIQMIVQLETEHLSSDEKKLLRSFQSLVVSFAQCGCMHNKAGDIQNAWNLANLCGVIRDYSKAISLGVWDGVVDTAEIFMHPVDTVCNIGTVLWLAGSNGAELLYDYNMKRIHFWCEGILYEDQGRYQKSVDRINQKLNVAKETLDKVWEQIQDSSGTERARFIARMATGIVLQKPSFRMAGKLLKRAKEIADAVVKSKKAVELANGLGRAGVRVLEGTRQAAGGAVNAVRRSVLPPLARARLAMRKACGDCKQLIEKGKCFFEHGCECCKDAFTNSERGLLRLLENCHPRFRSLVQSGCEMNGAKAVVDKIKLGLSEMQFMKLRRFFNVSVETTGSLNGVAIPSKFTFSEGFLRHIFTGELKFLMKSNGEVVGKLSGFHFDFLEKDIARKAFKLKDVVRNKVTGAYKGVIQRRLTRALGKSFFPEHWTAEVVAEKIAEALKNLSSVELERGRFVLIGITSEGLKMEIVADSLGKLITAYPIV